jgi:hypothetical protein
MTDYSDNFNRANGAPGSNWTAVNSGTWTIANNALTQTNVAGAYRGLRWDGGAFAGNNLYVRATARGPSWMGFGVLVRCPGSGTALTDIDGYGLMLFVGDQRYRIEFLNGDDSANTGLGGTVSAATDYTIEIQADGSTITALVGGSQVAQWTDTTYTSGGVMLLVYGGTITFDNFEAGDIAASGITGVASITQAAQSVAAAGSVAIVGGASITQDGQSVAAAGAAGAVAVVGVANITQAGNTVVLPHALRFYGNASAQIDRIRIPLEDGASAQYPVNVGAGDFTVEAWIRCAYADNDTAVADVRYSNIIYDRDSWGEQRGHCIGVTRNGSNLVAIFGQAGSGGGWSAIRSASHLGDGAWHHVAVTRNQGTGQVRIWVDGASEASGTYDTSNWSYPAGHTIVDGQDNEYAVIGTEKHDVGYGYNGWVDELRISDVVRYTSSFTPGRRFEPDSDAVGLYHFDDATGTVVSDSAAVAGAPTNGELLVGGAPSGPVWGELPTGTIESVAVVGVASISQADQSAAATGVVAVVGVASVSQADQSAAATGNVGNVPIIGSANLSQDDNTVAAAGVVAVVGVASISQADQSAAATGVVAVVGVASISQADQSAAATGNVGNVPIIGSANLSQDDNTVAAACVVAIVGAGVVTQDSNTLAATSALDLVLAVIYGAVLGVRAAGTVRGSRATGSM